MTRPKENNGDGNRKRHEEEMRLDSEYIARCDKEWSGIGILPKEYIGGGTMTLIPKLQWDA